MTQQQIDEVRERVLELPELIVAVEKLLRDGDEFARQMAEFRVDEISPLPNEIGNFHEPKLTAMRRLLCGQTLGISRRAVREILRHLKNAASTSLTKGEWLSAADSEGWWWHWIEGYDDPYICTVKLLGGVLVEDDPWEIPASVGKWQKVIGPFNKGD